MAAEKNGEGGSVHALPLAHLAANAKGSIAQST
jgi:hypothetical protein